MELWDVYEDINSCVLQGDEVDEVKYVSYVELLSILDNDPDIDPAYNEIIRNYFKELVKGANTQICYRFARECLGVSKDLL